MSQPKRDQKGRFRPKTKRQRLSDNLTKIICNVAWMLCVVTVAAILTASNLDLTEGLLVALAAGAQVVREVVRA